MISLQALHDLDIFAHGKKQGCLFDELNHCQTKGGSAVLKEWFYLRNTTAETIRQRQEAIRYLAEHNRYTLPISENDIYYSEQYLNSSFGIISSDRKLVRIWRSWYTTAFQSYRYHFILSGVKQLLSVINHIRLLCVQFQSPTLPVLLKVLFDEVKTKLLIIGIDEQQHEALTNSPSTTLLFDTDKKLRVAHKDDVMTLLQLYYQLDAYISLSLAHQYLRLSFPTITKSSLQLSGVYHPLVKGCIPNSVSLDNNTNLLIITGPNMAGKSTLMKSIGLAFFMAYLGIGVAAKDAQVPIVDELITSINIEDNITAGYSYFFSEVQNISNITWLLSSGKRLLVIADELFKGTNVQDAFDCSKVVLTHFLGNQDSLFIFSTHIAELAADLEYNKQCNLRYVDANVLADKIVFDYTLKPGINRQRLGINILRQQLPALFIDTADNTVI